MSERRPRRFPALPRFSVLPALDALVERVSPRVSSVEPRWLRLVDERARRRKVARQTVERLRALPVATLDAWARDRAFCPKGRVVMRAFEIPDEGRLVVPYGTRLWHAAVYGEHVGRNRNRRVLRRAGWFRPEPWWVADEPEPHFVQCRCCAEATPVVPGVAD